MHRRLHAGVDDGGPCVGGVAVQLVRGPVVIYLALHGLAQRGVLFLRGHAEVPVVKTPRQHSPEVMPLHRFFEELGLAGFRRTEPCRRLFGDRVFPHTVCAIPVEVLGVLVFHFLPPLRGPVGFGETQPRFVESGGRDSAEVWNSRPDDVHSRFGRGRPSRCLPFTVVLIQ